MTSLQPANPEERAEGAGVLPAQLYTVAGLAGTVAGAYHGYRRNGSIGWALLWSLAGAVVPFVTIPIAVGQGFGEPATQRRGNPSGRTKRGRARRRR